MIKIRLKKALSSMPFSYKSNAMMRR